MIKQISMLNRLCNSLSNPVYLMSEVNVEKIKNKKFPNRYFLIALYSQSVLHTEAKNIILIEEASRIKVYQEETIRQL